MDYRDFFDSRNLKHYLEEISKFPVLTEEEEKKLGERIRQGDKEALQSPHQVQPQVRRLLRQEVPGHGPGPARPHRRGQRRADRGGQALRPHPRRPLRLLRRLVDPPGHHPRPDALFAHHPHPPEAGRPDLAHEEEDGRAQDRRWAGSRPGRRSPRPWGSRSPTSRTSRSWRSGTCP